MEAIGFPLATCADQTLAKLAAATGSVALAKLDGTMLLCERAMLAGMKISGRISAGGGCRMFDALGDTIALNLARPADRELLPALLETDEVNTADDGAMAALIAQKDASSLVARGRMLGLAVARLHERLACTAGLGFGAASEAAPRATTRLGVGRASGAVLGTGAVGLGTGAAGVRTGAAGPGVRWAGAGLGPESRAECVELVTGLPAITPPRRAPRVVDLSALWAGPLAAHLLWLAGAEVVKVESRTRPDGMRAGHSAFYALLNQGKASVALDFADANDRQALLSLIATADIVIEAARPRALAQLGIDAAKLVRTTAGLVWVSITAHGTAGESANWVGFGDDCGVAGGLSAALHAVTGRAGFVGDAIADPLTGMLAALVAWEAWKSPHGGRFGLAMSRVIAQCLAAARDQDPSALELSLTAWSAAVGQPFPTVNRRPIGALPSFGENTRSYLAKIAQCRSAPRID
jgi:hypothetical protein